MAFLLIILAVIAGRCKKDGISHVFKSFTLYEYQSIMDGTSSVIRVQMVIWYSGATIWKLNRGFFDPSNCNAVYLVSLIAEYVPVSLTPDWLVHLAAWSAPYCEFPYKLVNFRMKYTGESNNLLGRHRLLDPASHCTNSGSDLLDPPVCIHFTF